MTWVQSFPDVETMATTPCFVIERKWWPWDAALIASTAMPRDPSVPFLNPTGKDRPLANSR